MKPRRLFAAAVTAALLTGIVTSPVEASHLRATYTGVTYSAGVLTWAAQSGWRKGSVDELLGGGIDVTLAGNPVPDVVVTVPTPTEDLTNPLFDVKSETGTLDINAILDDPGTYQAYVTDCCRVGGVVNTNSNGDFSQSFTFTVNGNGSVNLPPTFDDPSLYTLVPTGDPNGLTLDYSATDPTAEVVTYSQRTTTTAPEFGASALACSTMTGSVFRLAASLCTGGDVFATIYTAGAFFAVKVRATDASGNWVETDTLLRVPALPAPEIDDIDYVNGNAVIDVVAEDTVVTSFSVTCTAVGDPSDVHTRTSASSPLTFTNLKPDTEYACVPSATNAIGTATGAPENTTTPFATSQTSSGASGSAQSVTVTVPSGGSITLLDSSNNPVTTVTVAGQGTYVLDPGTGAITFTPASGFTGTATPVTYRITNSSNATANALYTPTVTSASAGSARVTAPSLVKNAYRIPAFCSLTSGTFSRCRIVAYATVDGRRVTIGATTLTSGGSTRLGGPVILNKTGRSLAARPNGVAVSLVATVTPVGSSTTRTARTTSRVVAPIVSLRSVYFASDSARLSAADRRYLEGVRANLRGVRSVTCVGHADIRSDATYNIKLAKRRASAVCAVLTSGKQITVKLVSRGEREAVTDKSRSRRVDPKLTY